MNEVPPQRLARLAFAEPWQLREAKLHKEQVTKAHQILNKVRGEYGLFPYRG